MPGDAIYPLNLGDETGKPLDGANKYTLHFDKAPVPPVNAFWSVTLYDTEGYQVPNTFNRFAVSSWMPFKYNADGSLDLYFQNENPGEDKVANWLSSPKGAFNLTILLYAPKSDALTGKWNPPPITRAQGWRRRAGLHSGIERLARTYQGAGEPAAPSSSGLGARSAYLLRADAG